MANHGYGHLNVPIDDEELERALRYCIRDHFNDMLNLEVGYAEDGNYFVIWAGEHRVYECWLEKPNKLEVRHGHASKVAWWVDGFVTSYVVERFGGYITDDADEDKRACDFHKRFPKYSAYLELYVKNMNWLKKRAWLKLNNELDEHDFAEEFLFHIL